jgi:hypothetical protein
MVEPLGEFKARLELDIPRWAKVIEEAGPNFQ